jgi:hypothetical protein
VRPSTPIWRRQATEFPFLRRSSLRELLEQAHALEAEEGFEEVPDDTEFETKGSCSWSRSERTQHNTLMIPINR